jgi:hypothetical protein
MLATDGFVVFQPLLIYPRKTHPKFKDPVFTKTTPKRSFSVIQNERFELVFAKTGSIILGTVNKSNV